MSGMPFFVSWITASSSDGCPEVDSRLCMEDYDVSFGVPSSLLDPDDPNDVYESEGEYLERLGLK